jgi:hypothetical protein
MSKTYSPKDVDISFGPFNIDGWENVSISRNSDNTSHNQSADGVTSYTKIADSTGMMELEVQQQNDSVNAYLAAIQKLQEESDDLLFFDATITDKSGGVFAYANSCHLQKSANQDLAAEAGSRTWTFFIEDLAYNPSPSGLSDATGKIAAAVAAANTLKSNTTNI